MEQQGMERQQKAGVRDEQQTLTDSAMDLQEQTERQGANRREEDALKSAVEQGAVEAASVALRIEGLDENSQKLFEVARDSKALVHQPEDSIAIYPMAGIGHTEDDEGPQPLRVPSLLTTDVASPEAEKRPSRTSYQTEGEDARAGAVGTASTSKKFAAWQYHCSSLPG